MKTVTKENESSAAPRYNSRGQRIRSNREWRQRAETAAEALRELKSIGDGGVVERRETGKQTWHALDEVSRIATQALAKLEES